MDKATEMDEWTNIICAKATEMDKRTNVICAVLWVMGLYEFAYKLIESESTTNPTQVTQMRPPWSGYRNRNGCMDKYHICCNGALRIYYKRVRSGSTTNSTQVTPILREWLRLSLWLYDKANSLLVLIATLVNPPNPTPVRGRPLQ